MESTKKSHKHISTLPEEVMIRIFSFLCVSDLLNAKLVCQGWRQTISKTFCLFDKLRLRRMHFETENHDEIDAMLNSLSQGKVYFSRVWLNLGYPYDKFKPDCESMKLKVFNTIASSLVNHLMSLELCNINMQHGYIEGFTALSHCKFLKSLSMRGVHFSIEDTSLIKPAEFNTLQNLSISDTSLFVIELIRCKKLDKFAFPYPPSSARVDQSYSSIIKFLNHLEHCDEIELSINRWNFECELMPKFLWNKLKLTCSNTCDNYNMHRNATFSIARLCKASTATAEAKICLWDCYGTCDIWNTIMFNCKRIKALKLCTGLWHLSSVASSARSASENHQLQNLQSIRTLKIRPVLLKDDNFKQLFCKLHNVVKLELLYEEFGNEEDDDDYDEEEDEYDSDDDEDADSEDGKVEEALPPPEFMPELQPFIDQIKELALAQNFFGHDDIYRANYIYRISFKNLMALTVQPNEEYSFWDEDNLPRFKKFLSRHPHCTHLNVQVNEKLEGNSLIKFYNSFHSVTQIATCNIMGRDYKKNCYVNWRSLEQNEVKIFGKDLTEDERRFFV